MLGRRSSDSMKAQSQSKVDRKSVAGSLYLEHTKSELKEIEYADDYLEKEVLEESSHSINYRQCSWVKTSGLLLSEYIVIAIMSFPNSYSVLGIVPGLILTVFVAFTVLYTGLIILDYCAVHPHLTSVCDIGQNLFGGYRWVWYIAALAFLLNNVLIQGLHVLTGAEYFNTISDNKTICSVVFSVVTTIICVLISLPRTFSALSFLAYFSSIAMFVSVVLAMVFAGVQTHPDKFEKLQKPVKWNLWPEEGTTYVQGMSAFLNIVYTFVGQITYPSFISQMKRPKDFRKALYAVTLIEVIVFSLAGSIVYVYVGNAYITAPAFGSLRGNYKKIAFSFALPTILFAGALYGNVSSQFLFQRVFRKDSPHRNSHTLLGWFVWFIINLLLWVIAFVIGEVIPFFSDLLSLMSSLFDCWFGFVFWGVAYFRLRSLYCAQRGEVNLSLWQIFKRDSLFRKLEFLINAILIGIGLYILGPGLYSAVDLIVLSYQSNKYGSPFTCASSAI